MYNRPIITSLLDDDMYKFTMGAVVFHNFPNALVTYGFFNRGRTQFPDGFADELRNQIAMLAKLDFTKDEIEWLKSRPEFRRTYVDFLKGYRMDPSEINVVQVGGDLGITIRGYWYRTIFWEVKLMAIISELYFELTGHELAPDWADRIVRKAINLSNHGAWWSDFGTRRRRSFEVQNRVVSVMKHYKGFLGTSNLYLAMICNVSPIGTSAHEAVMAMAAFVGYKMANKAWRNYWQDYYKGQLGIALTDTFTSEVFFRDFDAVEARSWDGLRQDSGDPNVWMEMALNFYRKIGVDTRGKKFVFSDNLTDQKFVELTLKWKELGIIIGGIGTNFTNDTFTEQQKIAGMKALNMVIKLTGFDCGDGIWYPTIKLSDDAGKHTGDKRLIEIIQEQLRIK